MPTHTFDIPYPPTVNHYWGVHKHRRFLTDKAVQFKKDVANKVLITNCPKFENLRLEVTITLYPRDKRVRDIDNSLKSCLDALCSAGVFNDDSQIDVLLVLRGEIIKNGKATVTIKNL